MDEKRDARRALVLELSCGAAVVEGRRIELPPREFALLRALAERPGEAVALDELIRAAWPESHEWTPKDDLYVLMTRLRRAIDGDARFGDHIRNRRGFGYMLDLSPDQVSLVPTLAGQGAAKDVEEPNAPSQTIPPETAARARDVIPHRRRARLRPVAIALVSLIAVVASWVIGFNIAGHDGVDVTQDRARPSAEETPAPQADREGARKSNDTRQQKKDPGEDKGKDEGESSRGDDAASPVGSGETTLIASAPSAPEAESQETSTSQPSADTGVASGQPGQQKEREPEPPPPPQPDAVLYHLVNAEGEHFMTTSSSSAEEKRAAGYSMSGEGRVFSSSEEGTVAIGLHEGSAYVYASVSGAPEGSNVAALYKLSKAGRFFYTTSSSLANQAQAEGWGRVTAGYVLI